MVCRRSVSLHRNDRDAPHTTRSPHLDLIALKCIHQGTPHRRSGAEQGDGTPPDLDGAPSLRNQQAPPLAIALLQGKHPIRIAFFENGGGAGCIVRIGGPATSYAVIPDEMWSYGGSILPSADLNGDGLVNGADLGILFSGWLQPGPTDLDGDGTTNGTDMGLLLAAWSG